MLAGEEVVFGVEAESHQIDVDADFTAMIATQPISPITPTEQKRHLGGVGTARRHGAGETKAGNQQRDGDAGIWLKSGKNGLRSASRRRASLRPKQWTEKATSREDEDDGRDRRIRQDAGYRDLMAVRWRVPMGSFGFRDFQALTANRSSVICALVRRAAGWQDAAYSSPRTCP